LKHPRCNWSPGHDPAHLFRPRSPGRLLDTIVALAQIVAPPVLRTALAAPFLRSGLTRWDAPGVLSPATLYLFEEQFRLHLFGRAYPLPAPDQLALLTACAEIVLPALLLLGLGTRLAALALLAMTGVIQLVNPEGGPIFTSIGRRWRSPFSRSGRGLALDRWIGRHG
jgi:putative oxidoreductase